MGQVSLTGYQLRRKASFQVLKWRTLRHRDAVGRYLDALAVALERRGWHCVRTVASARTPLLHVSGVDGAVTTLSVLTARGGWWIHEVPRGRGGFLGHCGDNIEHAAQVIDRLFRRWPQPPPSAGDQIVH